MTQDRQLLSSFDHLQSGSRRTPRDQLARVLAILALLCVLTLIITDEEGEKLSTVKVSTIQKIDSFKQYLQGDGEGNVSDEAGFSDEEAETVLPVFDASLSATSYDPADFPTHSKMYIEKRRVTAIVAGSQKCGTSALAAYLSSHPSIQFSRVKEVHHFDIDKNFKKGLKKYNAQWPIGPGDPDFEGQLEELRKDPDFKEEEVIYDQVGVAKSKASTPVQRYGVRAEATPYYIASNVACERIAKTFDSADDDYRMIVMIREPTERAWSEYQMETRRIEDDAKNREVLEKHATSMFSCYAQYKLPLFAQGKRLDADGLQKYEECLPEEITEQPKHKKVERTLATVMNKGRGGGVKALKTATKANTLAKQVNQCWEPAVPSDADAFMELVDTITKGDTFIKDEMTEQDIRRQIKIKLENGVLFKLGCLGEKFFEKLESPDNAFRSDMISHQTCKLANKNYDETSLSSITSFVNTCYRTPSKGITKQFLYRSLFAPQLQRCMDQGIDPSKIFLIDSETFKTSPREIMTELHKFIGVEDFDYDFDTPEEVHKQINKRFPSFEFTTGWRFDGSTVEMPEKIKNDVAKFMKPFNLLLQKMMKKGTMKGARSFSFEN
ncbi:hypothetical protein TrLO_g577 [Triparma laevis f. longispina]|uniref:Sulfotransferase domain-containing protein n=1 Tax=Triparma laevis f. longispina TaxID=1714387 RepID=A0A9W7E5Z9_9STRA|nr:hypothetical protein TrLO_g577 [Triparma laevis f. longispina]